MLIHRKANKLAATAALVASLSFAGLATASTGPADRVEASQWLGPLSDAAELETFLDDAMARVMAEHDVPGGTISVVQDDSVLLAKGYGLADLAEQRPVVGSDTLFRIGSVTKLFTWTAVMQLVEQGRLDLHANVNVYLHGFQIPNTFAEPITMAHLMTHTAGFEDRGLGLSVLDPEDRRPLATFLAADMPARIFSPGEVTAYSNYGTALAGYVVEQVTGEPIETYVEAHILEPLDMHRTTMRQALPAQLDTNLAVSYVNHTGVHEALPREYFDIVPASGMSATATDMANFMIAHLQDGRFRDRQILQPATAQAMHARQFTNDENVSGMTYGFAELVLSNQRLITHRGTTNFEQFQSYLVLLPDHDVGLFVSFNSESGGPARTELVQLFLDRYYPQEAPQAIRPLEGAADDASRFAGTYGSTRSNETTIEKFVGLIPTGIDVVAGDDGTLVIAGGPLGSQARSYRAIAPLLYRQIDGWEHVAFHADDDGQVTSLFVGSMPIAGFTKQAWWQTGTFGLALLGVVMIVFLLSVAVLPIAWRRSRRVPGANARGALLARGLAWLVSLLFVLFPIVLIAGLSSIEEGVGWLARFALAIGAVASVLTAGLVIATVSAFRSRGWGAAAKAYQAITVAAAVAFVWFLNNWNLLGVRL